MASSDDAAITAFHHVCAAFRSSEHPFSDTLPDCNFSLNGVASRDVTPKSAYSVFSPYQFHPSLLRHRSRQIQNEFCYREPALLRAAAAAARDAGPQHVPADSRGRPQPLARHGVRLGAGRRHRAAPYRLAQCEARQRVDARSVHCDGLRERASGRLGRVRHGLAAAQYLGSHDLAGYGSLHRAGRSLVSSDQWRHHRAGGLDRRQRREGSRPV